MVTRLSAAGGFEGVRCSVCQAVASEARKYRPRLMSEGVPFKKKTHLAAMAPVCWNGHVIACFATCCSWVSIQLHGAKTLS